jgi:hypothetical protein
MVGRSSLTRKVMQSKPATTRRRRVYAEDLGNSVREVVGAGRGVNDSILTFRWSGAFHNDAAAKQSRSSHDACPHLSTSYHA